MLGEARKRKGPGRLSGSQPAFAAALPWSQGRALGWAPTASGLGTGVRAAATAAAPAKLVLAQTGPRGASSWAPWGPRLPPTRSGVARAGACVGPRDSKADPPLLAEGASRLRPPPSKPATASDRPLWLWGLARVAAGLPASAMAYCCCARRRRGKNGFVTCRATNWGFAGTFSS